MNIEVRRQSNNQNTHYYEAEFVKTNHMNNNMKFGVYCMPWLHDILFFNIIQMVFVAFKSKTITCN